jgi:hypothetical protein
MVDARNTALKVLTTLDRDRQTLDGILDDITPRTGSLSRRDRALFNTLIFGVLRWRGRLDYIISHFSNTPLKKIEPGVLNILRLGLFQTHPADRCFPRSRLCQCAAAQSRRKPRQRCLSSAEKRSGGFFFDRAFIARVACPTLAASL